MQIYSLLFYQGDAAQDWLNMLDREGEHATTEKLLDHFLSTDAEPEPQKRHPTGAEDNTFHLHKPVYTYQLSYNDRIGYIGLSAERR